MEQALSSQRHFRLRPEEIDSIVVGMGSCIASDRITVDGMPVGYMYREIPDDSLDSGWRFFSGDESQDYLDNQEHLAIYDVNTIANYDRSIVTLLNDPVMSAYARNKTSGPLEAIAFPHPGPEIKAGQ